MEAFAMKHAPVPNWFWNAGQSKKKCNKLIKRQLIFKVQIALYRKKLRQFVPEAKAQEKGLFKP